MARRGRRQVSRRGFLGLAGGAGTAALLAACGATGDDGDGDDAPIQLVYQDWRTEWFPPMAQEMLGRFHAEHPGIRVFYTPDPENVEEALTEDLRAGTAPDVFTGCCTHFPGWAQEGFTLDLRPFVEADLDAALIADWDQAQYQALFTPDGHQFALPKYHGALALYYNKDLFDEHGVAYPDGSWDHDDYLRAMRRLTLDRDGDGRTDVWGSMVDVSWDRIQMHVNGWGGHLVDPGDPRRCLMAEPAALDALEWVRARMWDDRVMATFPDVQNLSTSQAFIAGKLAMVEDGSWVLKDVLSRAEFRVGVAPFPAGPARQVTLATTDGWGIYAGTKHPEAAWELLKFLVSEEYGRAMARAAFLQPARHSLVDDWVSYIRAEFPQRARDVDIAAFADGHRGGYSVTAEVFANMPAARRLTYAAWDQILTLGTRPAELIADACVQVQASQE